MPFESGQPIATSTAASFISIPTPGRARGKRDLITVVGHAAVISAREFIQASGEWANDRTRGVQFRARFLKTMPPATIEGIEKYLGLGMIRGIGPVYARKLVQAFGSRVARYLANHEPISTSWGEPPFCIAFGAGCNRS